MPDQPVAPDLLDARTERDESHGALPEKSERARRGGFVPISSPVDHVALYAALEALSVRYPELMDGYRKDALPLLLEHLLALWGTQEVAGPESSGIIDGWLVELGDAAGPIRDDSAEWCCIPLAVAVQRSGYPLPQNAPWSRSWASWGVSVPAGHERLGDVLTLSRGLPGAFKGHAGLAVKWEPEHVAVLGGNVSDKVGIGWYERGMRLLAVRRPDPEWSKVAA
jgi:hypothetical protein